MFDWKKPTAQMLGRFQPWHAGHRELFKKAHNETGQVVIMIRDVSGIIGTDAGAGRTKAQMDNPFDFYDLQKKIAADLFAYGNFIEDEDYIIMQVPNIVDISYGRGVGYTFTQHELPATIERVNATEIRAQMRESGELESVAELGGERD